MKTQTQYQYGDCIPESIKIYHNLLQRNYMPKMVEGWIEVNKDNDILPDKYFLMMFFPNEFEKLDNIDYNNYPKVLQHTWVEVNGHKIDITKNQFDMYGGVKQYYTYEKYHISSFGFKIRTGVIK